MKLAVLIQCHKNPEQINRLLNAMKNDSVDFFIHIDKKSNIEDLIERRADVHILAKSERVDVSWGTFSQVQATLNLLNFAASAGNYDYYFLISGQDFPIQSVESLLNYLSVNVELNYINFLPSLNNGLNKQNNYDKRNQIVFGDRLLKRNLFMRTVKRLWITLTGGYNKTFKIFRRKNDLNLKFYFGSQWWCLNREFVEYLFDYLRETPQYIEFFKKTSCPDESFFQTAFMNSSFKAKRKEYLHYIDWTEGKNSPKNLTVDDFDKIIQSGKFMARKIDNDFELIDKLEATVKNGRKNENSAHRSN